MTGPKKLVGRAVSLFLLALVLPGTAYGNPVVLPVWATPAAFLVAAILAAVVEVLVAAGFVIGSPRFRISRRTLAVIAGMNLVTNPLLNWRLYVWRPPNLVMGVLGLEAAVVTAEWVIVVWLVERPPWTLPRVLGVVLLMNAASLATGLFVVPAVMDLMPGLT